MNIDRLHQQRTQVILLVVIGLFFLFFLIQTSVAAPSESWEAIITVSSDQISTKDTVIIGEAVTATDGNSPDSLDTPKTIPPMTPYVRCWADDNLDIPYHQLWKDYRSLSGQQKIWNVTIQWIPENHADTASITISWEPIELVQSNYDSITLYNDKHGKVMDMLIDSSYTFNATAMMPYEFNIIAMRSEQATTNQASSSSPSSVPLPSIGQSNSEPIAEFIVIRKDEQMDTFAFEFNASESYDPDVDIISYHWDFGDDSEGVGKIVTHSYDEPGTYRIVLTVTNTNDLTAFLDRELVIDALDYRFPGVPVIQGPIYGSVNTSYSYTIAIIDSDDETVNCSIDWDDGHQAKNPRLVTQNTRSIEHQWEHPGVYQVQVSISNGIATSNTSVTVYINSYPVPTHNAYDLSGYFIDTNNDTIYDTFYHTNLETYLSIAFHDSWYLLDLDSNGYWDIMFTLETNEFVEYKGKQSGSETAQGFSFDSIIIALVIGIVLLISLVYMVKNRVKKTHNKS